MRLQEKLKVFLHELGPHFFNFPRNIFAAAIAQLEHKARPSLPTWYKVAVVAMFGKFFQSVSSLFRSEDFYVAAELVLQSIRKAVAARCLSITAPLRKEKCELLFCLCGQAVHVLSLCLCRYQSSSVAGTSWSGSGAARRRIPRRLLSSSYRPHCSRQQYIAGG